MTALVLVFLFLLILWTIYLFAFRTRSPHHENPHKLPDGEQYRAERARMLKMVDDLLAVPCERVNICSRDGLLLSARYYHVRDGAPVEIEFHGYRGSAIRDFCGGNRLAREAGRNVLLVDQRAGGESQGRTIGFGVLERQDCLDWIGYALNRFGGDTKLLLSGVSMGAATVLMATELDLPANVVGVIADSPYSSPEAIIRKVGSEMRLPMHALYPLVRLSARLFGRFDPDAASPLQAVRSCRVPVLLIHGDDDRFVPCRMSRELAEVCASPVTLHITPGAGHGLSFIVDEAAYTRVTREFCEKLGV